MLKVFEAFSGYGSQSIALERLGIEHKVVGISEIDKNAIKAYYALHNDDIRNYGDISQIKPEDLPEFDLFTYSFPCTDISLSGKVEGIVRGQTRSGLLYECEKSIMFFDSDIEVNPNLLHNMHKNLFEYIYLFLLMGFLHNSHKVLLQQFLLVQIGSEHRDQRILHPRV